MSIDELAKGQHVTIGNGRAWWTVASIDTYGTIVNVTVTRVDNAGRSYLKVFTARQIARGELKVVA